jgi:molybdopterin converting factor small subunit
MSWTSDDPILLPPDVRDRVLAAVADRFPFVDHDDAGFVATPEESWRIWPELVGELRARFPELAARVLTEDGAVATTFALVVNDEVVAGGRAPAELGAGDEISLIAIMAGG